MNLQMMLLLQFCLMTFLKFEGSSQSSWRIEKSKDGIEVYTRTEKDSDFNSFKAIIHVDASVSQVVETLRDVDNYAQWYGYTKTSKLLRRETDVQYNYVETIFPWPYSNRDMVYKMSINPMGSEAVEISLTGIPDYLPEKKGIVRMKKAKGRILLQPLENKTKIIYVFHSEPGKNVPPWLANNSITELPYKTFIGLRDILEPEDKTGQ